MWSARRWRRRSGLRRRTEWLVRERVLSDQWRDHHVAYSLGTAYAQLGDTETALRWLETAADTGFPCLVWFERDPLLDPIRRHPGFSRTLEHVKNQRHAVMSRLETTGR